MIRDHQKTKVLVVSNQVQHLKVHLCRNLEHGPKPEQMCDLIRDFFAKQNVSNLLRSVEVRENIIIVL